MPGQNVLGDFHFPERAYPERFSYSVVWEVYLRRSVYTRESFKLYYKCKENNERREGKQLYSSASNLGNNKQKRENPRNTTTKKLTVKIKKNEPYLRGASPIVLFSFSLCHVYISHFL